MLLKTFNQKKKLINISYENNFIKVNINDFIHPTDFTDKICSDKKINIKKFISMNILWNSDLQMINKGTYYIVESNDAFYNILIKDNIIEIDERKNINDEKEERILTINTDNNNYKYCSLKHDKHGSTYNTKYYSNANIALIALEFTEQEAKEDMSILISNLKQFSNINDILDIELIENIIINKQKQL